MNIDELRSAQSKERQKSDLQQLRESFYGDVAAYVEELEAERERAAERAEDPFGSPEVQQLTNDIETAKDTAEAIYERRLGKIVKKASLVSAEMANPNDVNGLTAEEQALFSDLVERIEENKAHMLDVIAGDAPPGARDDATAGGDASASGEAGSSASADAASADAAAPHPEDGLDADADSTDDDRAGVDEDARRSEAAAVADVPDEPPVDGDAPDPEGGDHVPAADLMGGDDAPANGDANDHDANDRGANDREDTGGREPASSDGRAADASGATDTGDDQRATLRVTENVGEIFGVDEREYRLAAEDVVTLPEENADVLVAQGAAERLD
jgi:DNA replication factor GINS